MSANYTDATGTPIASSSSSNSISIQLAPSAPTGLELFGTPTPDTFTVVWEKVADPPQISNYLTSYEFKRDGVSITGTITDISIPTFTPQVVLASIGTPDAGTRGTIGIFNNVYYISAVNPYYVWAILRIPKYGNYDIYDNNKAYTEGDVVTYSGSIYAMTERISKGYNPSTPFWNQIVPTGTTVLATATFTGLVSGSFISAFNVYAKYTKSGATAITSVPSNTIAVQLAPPAPSITALTDSTLTNTGFTIQWNNITVPAGSPYTLSYTFSGTYSGLTAGTRTIVSSVTTWPFTVTSLPNGGTVTNISITATYTSGALTLSTASTPTPFSVTIPGLAPTGLNFISKTTSWVEGDYWTYYFTGGGKKYIATYLVGFTGGNPTSMEITSHFRGISASDPKFTVNLTSGNIISPGLVRYDMEYTLPTLPRPFGDLINNTYLDNLTLTNNIGTTPIIWGGAFKFPPGRLMIALRYKSGKLCDVYVYMCEYAANYYMKLTWLGTTVYVGFTGDISYATLRDNATYKYQNSGDWRYLGTMNSTTPSNYPVKYHIGVNNGAGIYKELTLNVKTISAATTYTGWDITLDIIETRNFDGTITTRQTYTGVGYSINSNSSAPPSGTTPSDFSMD